MADLDHLALSLPETSRELSEDGRPSYTTNGKMFAFHRGRRKDAVRLFERLLSLRNDVGLLSEEYDPRYRRLVGNFPQAFSHLALVNTASNLAQSEKPAEQRSERKVEEPAQA